ncbi:uncharacterized protein F4822DRAFT_402348 [Hypoxylon trugodes]|uniref:uncharacterized protein n=1 Tax=Hypoxylon trugodes TaxID=326681 RepID=UPI00219E6CD5|nr:uncharacterized protein F4822DRAFT_402348 [Hypoxylon trugodes]KAI1388278.1 hypothetical protein F4822DRAFT_402348 [Hypoxylon trugodes]
MGWLWSTPSPPPKGPNPNSNTPEETNKPTPKPESDYGDPEIAKFMAQIQAEFGSSNSDTKPAEPPQSSEPEKKTTTSIPTYNPSTTSSRSWSRSLWGPASKTAPPPPAPTTKYISNPSREAITRERLDPISESLLPTTMSCRSAFDAAFHCNSIGGQWTSVYRAGEVRSCSEHWDDFWFCMRTRTLSSPQKEDAIKDHYRKKEYEKYFAPGRPSSEDVWEARTERVDPGTTFTERLDLPDMSDEEWRKMELERWRRAREAQKKD